MLAQIPNPETTQLSNRLTPITLEKTSSSINLVEPFEPAILELLEDFHSHNLCDLNKAALMDRVDVKFMSPIKLLPALLKELKYHYSILEIDEKRISRYFNQYFDTSSLDFYQDHHNGKLNRFKVRQRTYLDTDTRFLEVKFKNNRKRTIKSRLNCAIDPQSEEACHSFIFKEMGTSFEDLQISQQGGYQRIALANEESAERVTIDFGLWYKKVGSNKKVQMDGFFIAELKQYKRSKLSPFYQLMSKYNISPSAFSKYCIGCALLYNSSIKTNQFKPVLRQIADFLPIN